MTDVMLLLTTVPSAAVGETIARTLVGERLAACVNVCPPMTSFFRWRGTIERDTEHQLVIKTGADRVSAVQARIKSLHPYELPECLVVPVGGGSADYLEWVRAETAEPGDEGTR